MIRRQPPAHSPISVAGLLSAIVASASPSRAIDGLKDFLTAHFAADLVVPTGSGTQALQAALSAASAGNAAPVALPAYSCFDVLTAAVGADLPVTFYDVDPLSLAPSAEGVRRSLERGARTVVVANLYGFPVPWVELREMCRDAGALVVEDAAQGLGSDSGGVRAGSLGDLSVLSFGRGKGWTGGGGGALLARGDLGGPALERWTDAQQPVATGLGGALRPFALSLAQWLLGRPTLYRLPTAVPGLGLGETRWKDPGPVRSIGGFEAAAALRNADASFRTVNARRSLAARWSEVWERQRQHAASRPCEPVAASGCGYLRFPVVAQDADEARRLVAMGRDNGIAAGYPRALPDLPPARRLVADDRVEADGARKLAETLLTAPTHAMVADRDVTAVEGLLSR